MSPTRLAIIGARGLGNYGGFETVAGEIAPRLFRKGFEVVCSHELSDCGTGPESLQGVMLDYFPFRFPSMYSMRKVFEILYDCFFVFKCSFIQRCDIIYCLGWGAGLVLFLPRLLGIPTVVNIDGVEWKRSKFGPIERSAIRLLYGACYLNSNRLILDNEKLLRHVPERFRSKTVYIPNGVAQTSPGSWDSSLLEKYVRANQRIVQADGYWLVVARLEPENNIHMIVRGYLESHTTKPLLIVGDYTSSRYRKLVHDTVLGNTQANKEVLFTGAIYNQSLLNMIRWRCFGYVHGHSVGGTNPSLLEAMSAKNIIIAHDNEFNREVCTDLALYFRESGELAGCIDAVEREPDGFLQTREKAQSRVLEKYNWDNIASEYDSLFRELIRQ